MSPGDKQLELNPRDADVYYNRAIAKESLNNKLGAITDYNQAIEINLKHAKAYYNRGSVKYSIGDKQGACLDWSKAGELGFDKAYESIKEYCNK